MKMSTIFMIAVSFLTIAGCQNLQEMPKPSNIKKATPGPKAILVIVEERKLLSIDEEIADFESKIAGLTKEIQIIESIIQSEKLHRQEDELSKKDFKIILKVVAEAKETVDEKKAEVEKLKLNLEIAKGIKEIQETDMESFTEAIIGLNEYITESGKGIASFAEASMTE